VNRFLVLFSRDPGREARAKGFGPTAEDLFTAFARGWEEAARRCAARLVIATPPEDLAAWRVRLPAPEVLWMTQSGSSFGNRLEGAARRAASLSGRVVIAGGDVAPDAPALGEAFDALERGADAVLAPAADGGVSLLSIGVSDLDLLARLAPRQGDAMTWLEGQLRGRGRSVARVAAAPDVDGRRSLRAFVRGFVNGEIRALARFVLRIRPTLPRRAIRRLRARGLDNPSGLRAPPALA
jgi:glycosyltransferase A (GT-A) superfamily protein (DUF2064 family)